MAHTKENKWLLTHMHSAHNPKHIQPHINTRWYNNEKQDWWILDGHKMECALIINAGVAAKTP